MKTLPENARILIVKFNAIGDLVMTTPAIRDLREAYPAARITLLVGSWSAPVIRKNPHLDEVIEFDPCILEFDKTPFLRRRWLDIFRLLLKIRRRRFDCAVILHALPAIHLFVRLTGIPLRYGMTRNGRRGAWLLTRSVAENLGANRYYAENYQEVTALAGSRSGPPRTEVHADAGDEAEARRVLAEAGLGVGEDFILVAPGGGRNPREDMTAKRWPKENFAAMVRDLLKDRPRLRVVLSGAEGDREENNFFAAEVPEALDLTAKLTLPQLVCAARASRAILCNDSAVLHIGVACGIPVVTPFGPTNARQFLPEWALPYSRQSEIACSPCYRIGGPFAGCPIGFKCLREETGTAEIRPLLEKALSKILE